VESTVVSLDSVNIVKFAYLIERSCFEVANNCRMCFIVLSRLEEVNPVFKSSEMSAMPNDPAKI
jgi:hypothetical protein